MICDKKDGDKRKEQYRNTTYPDKIDHLHSNIWERKNVRMNSLIVALKIPLQACFW